MKKLFFCLSLFTHFLVLPYSVYNNTDDELVFEFINFKDNFRRKNFNSLTINSKILVEVNDSTKPYIVGIQNKCRIKLIDKIRDKVESASPFTVIILNKNGIEIFVDKNGDIQKLLENFLKNAKSECKKQDIQEQFEKYFDEIFAEHLKEIKA